MTHDVVCVVIGVQALTNFVFIHVQQFRAITLILVDLLVIHSLAVHRRRAGQHY